MSPEKKHIYIKQLNCRKEKSERSRHIKAYTVKF